MNSPNKAAPKRRVKLINSHLQLTLAGAFATLTVLSLVVQSLLLGLFVSRLAQELPSGGTDLAAAIPTLLVKSLGASAVIVLPALLVIGIRITFRIAGPLYRMRTHLEAIARGERNGPCEIRKGDYLQDFCTTLNAAIEAKDTSGNEAPEVDLSKAA